MHGSIIILVLNWKLKLQKWNTFVALRDDRYETGTAWNQTDSDTWVTQCILLVSFLKPCNAKIQTALNFQFAMRLSAKLGFEFKIFVEVKWNQSELFEKCKR